MHARLGSCDGAILLLGPSTAGDYKTDGTCCATQTFCARQTALERQDLSRTYLAYHELEDVIINNNIYALLDATSTGWHVAQEP